MSTASAPRPRLLPIPNISSLLTAQGGGAVRPVPPPKPWPPPPQRPWRLPRPGVRVTLARLGPTMQGLRPEMDARVAAPGLPQASPSAATTPQLAPPAPPCPGHRKDEGGHLQGSKARPGCIIRGSVPGAPGAKTAPAPPPPPTDGAGASSPNPGSAVHRCHGWGAADALTTLSTPGSCWSGSCLLASSDRASTGDPSSCPNPSQPSGLPEALPRDCHGRPGSPVPLGPEAVSPGVLGAAPGPGTECRVHGICPQNDWRQDHHPPARVGGPQRAAAGTPIPPPSPQP